MTVPMRYKSWHGRHPDLDLLTHTGRSIYDPLAKRGMKWKVYADEDLDQQPLPDSVTQKPRRRELTV